MSIFEFKPDFIWSANDDGLAVRFSNTKEWHKAQNLKASQDGQRAYRRMQMLAECGEAEVRDVDGGIFVASADAVRLDESTRELFELPSSWPGGFRLKTEFVPNLPGFHARLGLVDSSANAIWNWRLRGPILEVGESHYLPTPAQFAALSAFKAWQDFSPKGELEHFSLLASLREAYEEGCLIDLEAYSDKGSLIVRADEVTVHSTEDKATGDLILCPLPIGSFTKVSAEEIQELATKIQERLAQLDGEGTRKVFRVGKRIILLDEEQTAVARAVKQHPRVPRGERRAFERNPAEWLSEHVFPDLPIEFSPRVTGIGEWQYGYFGGNHGDPMDWFPITVPPEKGNSEPVPEPEPSNSDDETEKPKRFIPLISDNYMELGYGWSGLGNSEEKPYKPNFSKYPRAPLPHQEEAIRWLLWHAKRVTEQPKFGAGALLADDMGLGKSFSTLIALAEWYQHYRDTAKAELPAAIFVVPLSLVLNWEEEMAKAFFGYEDAKEVAKLVNDRALWDRVIAEGYTAGKFPFRRIIRLQSDMELQNYKRSPRAQDVVEDEKVAQFGLCFGDGTERSIDFPGSCVITTYQTLRDYRFSFAAAQWGAAIFDEAQHIKNPNSIQTIAAKALRAHFRIALTGTPVENQLGDIWCILDTVEPGYMGAFAHFRKKWIYPMVKDPSRMQELGMELREQIEGLMLRRTKEESLKCLPGKSILPKTCAMSAEQEELYADARGAVNKIDSTTDAAPKGHHLAALWHLRQISLHPCLIAGGSIPTAKTEIDSRRILGRSGKLAWLLELLDKISNKGEKGNKGEKVLIFCVLKELQVALSAHLEVIYGLSVPIINGDTKASSRTNPEKARQGLIAEFSSKPGFGLCILSPIAAGAGLNITAANHVVHLERHWNPAKEAQATDRAYRIGQDKEVTVYLPSSTHSEFPSFDVILHQLLEKKRAIQGSLGLIPPDSVSGAELITEVFGQPNEGGIKDARPISLEDALDFSWQMYEALIAVLYERDAERVILTPQSADHGADVVVLGWGTNQENILIQCKFTKNDKLDSEEGIKAVYSSAPFFEGPLGVQFSSKILHTTAKKFSRRSKKSAQVCGVKLNGRAWLVDALKEHKPTLREVLHRSTLRERS